MLEVRCCEACCAAEAAGSIAYALLTTPKPRYVFNYCQSPIYDLSMQFALLGVPSD